MTMSAQHDRVAAERDGIAGLSASAVRQSR
jgi:hypothetical protein